MSRPKKRKRLKRSEQPDATAESPELKGPVAFNLGAGTEAYIEGESNMPNAFTLGGPVRLAGNFKHNPSQGGSSAYIRKMYGGPGSIQRAEAEQQSPAPSESTTARRSSTAFSRVSSATCACGFEAFVWQTKCPRCQRALGAAA
jgi:hypothetical protein